MIYLDFHTEVGGDLRHHLQEQKFRTTSVSRSTHGGCSGGARVGWCRGMVVVVVVGGGGQNPFLCHSQHTRGAAGVGGVGLGHRRGA